MKLLTPPGLAGIAIVEVEPGERDVLMPGLRLPSGKPCRPQAGGVPVRATLSVSGQVVDDVLVLAREDHVLELHCHGSPSVLDQLDRHFGVSLAVAETPAQRLLRESLSVEQFELAAEQLPFDFDVELARLRALPGSARARAVAETLQRSRIARALAAPFRVALVGRKNAGKSSLFNHLLFRERALTGSTPGLTRDPIAETTTLSGFPYELIDTAGLGEATDDLDALAIESGVVVREGAQLLLVVDGTSSWATEDELLLQRGALVVRSKSELPASAWPEHVRCLLEVSGAEQSSEVVRAALAALLSRQRELPSEAGAVGGVAALSADQWQQVQALGRASAQS